MQLGQELRGYHPDFLVAARAMFVNEFFALRNNEGLFDLEGDLGLVLHSKFPCPIETTRGKIGRIRRSSPIDIFIVRQHPHSVRGKSLEDFLAFS